MQSAGFQRLYCIGDSLTQQGFQAGGWLSLVADHFVRRYDVVNRGFSGYTTDYVCRILPSLLLRDEVKSRGDVVAVTICLGCNDAVLPEHDKRNVSVDEYTKNLRAMSAMLKEAGISPKRQVIIGVPPVAESKYQEHCKSTDSPMNLSDVQTEKYAQACRAVAEDLGTSYVELYTSMKSVESWPKFLSDGLHFSPEGNAFVASKVCDVLDAVLPPANSVYPISQDIDPQDPDIALRTWYLK